MKNNKAIQFLFLPSSSLVNMNRFVILNKYELVVELLMCLKYGVVIWFLTFDFVNIFCNLVFIFYVISYQNIEIHGK